MDSSSQPLTSTAADLFHYLKHINSEKPAPEPEIIIPPTQLDRAVSGKYKFEVHDDAGLVYDSGDWKVPELSEMFRVTKRRIYQIVNEANVNLLMYGEKDGSEE